MRRRYTRDAYLDLVGQIREVLPEVVLSTDMIVGFPGETTDDFEQTLQLVEQVRFSSMFSFKYSPRPGTPAAGAGDQVPEPVKSARLSELQTLLQAQQRAFNQSCVGRVIPVLLEKPVGCPFAVRCSYAFEQCKHENPPLQSIGATHRVACWWDVQEGRARNA